MEKLKITKIIHIPGVDSQLVTAAREMNDEQKNQPAWTWCAYADTYYISAGRWQKFPNQAPYVRLDIILDFIENNYKLDNKIPSTPSRYWDYFAKNFILFIRFLFVNVRMRIVTEYAHMVLGIMCMLRPLVNIYMINILNYGRYGLIENF